MEPRELCSVLRALSERHESHAGVVKRPKNFVGVEGHGIGMVIWVPSGYSAWASPSHKALLSAKNDLPDQRQEQDHCHVVIGSR
jgi:hypothetical protein